MAVRTLRTATCIAASRTISSVRGHEGEELKMQLSAGYGSSLVKQHDNGFTHYFIGQTFYFFFEHA